MFRHGDLLIVPVTAVPAEAKREKIKGDIILAEGEVTGHAHRIRAPQKAKVFAVGDARYLVLDGAVDLTHEEHATINLPPGRYEVRRQQVYTPAGIERVAD